MTQPVLDGLAVRLGDDGAQPSAAGRRAAVLALLRDTGGDAELVLTRRHDGLRHHPGQISLPGGRLERGETVEDAALREACEEVGLATATATLLGRLRSFWLPPSATWLSPVVARWDAPHDLVAQPSEVARILRVRVHADLLDPERLRGVHLPTLGWRWAWQLDGRHLLWGATGGVVEDLLARLDVGWPPLASSADLPPDRRVLPWRGPP